jgi:hypothetical protein
MKHRYQDIYAELLEMVPELRAQLEEQLKEPNEWEQALKWAGQEYSEADLEYLRQQIPPELQPKKPEPLLYVIFEDELRPLIISYVQQPGKSSRVAALMNWLEELARDGDKDTSNLVAIAICEGFIGNDSVFIPRLLPFMGETVRQMCRDCFPYFRVREEIKTLLAPRDRSSQA